MKNIFRTILICIGVLSMTSCSDFLDQKSDSEFNEKQVFSSTYYVKLALNKVYGDLTLDDTYSQYIPIVWGLNSDCELVDGLGSNATNTSNERGNMNYNSNPGWANLSRLWNSMYSMIENANMVVQGIEESPLIAEEGPDKVTTLRYKGEALALRSMLYYDLIKFFGDIPFKTEKTNSDLSNVLGKVDRDEIMDVLIENLKEAIEYLPWAGQAGYTTEHVTKGYAHALLANIALSRAGWHIREEAKEGYETAEVSDATYPTQRCGAEKRKEMYELALYHLSQVINNNTHTLNPSIENHWYLLNQRQLDNNFKENLFEIPMGLGKSGELGYTVGVRINGASARYGVKGNSSGKLKLTAPYLYSFDAKDLRRDLTCATYTLKEEGGILKENMEGNKPFEIYCAKWDIRKMNEEWRQAAIAAGEAKWMSGINVVRMRYPQILLMYAEVMNELYGPDAAATVSFPTANMTAREALKQVHTRAFADADKTQANQYIENIPADKESFFNAIVDENAWELAGEGFRKFDLIRWNLLSAKTEQMKTDYQNQMTDGTYPLKLYYKQNADFTIDMSSIHWYEEPADTKDYLSKDWFAKVDKTQLETNLPSISSGLLNGPVVNRYLLPIGSTTISASKGRLSNSYGFND